LVEELCPDELEELVIPDVESVEVRGETRPELVLDPFDPMVVSVP